MEHGGSALILMPFRKDFRFGLEKAAVTSTCNIYIGITTWKRNINFETPQDMIMFTIHLRFDVKKLSKEYINGLQRSK